VSFTVTAHTFARRFVYQHVSMLNALDQSMSLIAAGMADVRIADGNGLDWVPADLYSHVFGGSSAKGNRAVKSQTSEVSLAA
jgi:hypothetical protein